MPRNEKSNSITGAMTPPVLLGKRRGDITKLNKILLLRSSKNLSLESESVTVVIELRHLTTLVGKYS